MIAHTYIFKLKDGLRIEGDSTFMLHPFDEVYVHRSAGYTEQQSVTIEGEVMFAGVYALSQRETRLSDVIKKAGGPNHVAYIKGARLERKLNEAERVRLEESLQLAREQQQRNMMQMAQTSTNAMAIAQALRETKQDPAGALPYLRHLFCWHRARQGNSSSW